MLKDAKRTGAADGTGPSGSPGKGRTAPFAQGVGDGPVLTTEQAARYVGLSASTLAKKRVTGINSPPYVQAVRNGAVRYRTRDLDAWMDARTYSNTSER